MIISDGVVQYNLGRQSPDRFARKDTLSESLGRPNNDIRALLAKLKSIRPRKTLRKKLVGYLEVLQREPELAASYPGTAHDTLFESTYRHSGKGTCEECGCHGQLVSRDRLKMEEANPVIHIGKIASGDIVMKSGEHRDKIARQEGVIGFEMEGAGVWDCLPCIIIKGTCDYADSHKSKRWQRYAAATAAACAKALLAEWASSARTGWQICYPRTTPEKEC